MDKFPKLEIHDVHLVKALPSRLDSRFYLLLAAIGVSLVTFQLWRTWYRLRHIPGPWLASITNLQRVSWVWTKRYHLILQEEHTRHGDLVRIGPNMVSFSNADAIPTVYPMRTGFPKSFFYNTLAAYTPGKGSLPAVFNTQDETLHKALKSPIASLYSNSSMTATEGLVNDVIRVIEDKFDTQFCPGGQVFDLGSWLQYFAFDVMGTMTFSKRYGFLEEGRDVGGMLATIKLFMRSAAPWTQIPWLDKVVNKTWIGDRIRRTFFKIASMTIIGFVAKSVQERKDKLEKGEAPPPADSGRKDFLTRFLEIQGASPNVPPWGPTAWTFSNVIAGSDSVGTVMRTTMYNLLAYPHTLAKVYDELRNANLTMPIPVYTEIQDLPYLDACVKEASRIHPPFALPFERVVPKGGVTVLGQYLPEGTCVGGNPYVVNRDKTTFGDDAEFWRPERWLEKDEAHKRKLEQGVLTFGAGRRVCMGKAIGIFEVKKIIAFLILHYEIRIVDKEKFQVENSWFFIQKGLYAQIKRRENPIESNRKQEPALVVQ